MTRLRELMNRRAREQHGLIHRRQIDPAGGDAAVRHMVDAELGTYRWEPVAPSVWRSTAAPVTQAQRLMVAVLSTGEAAMVSHGTAASLWGVDAFDVEPIEVTRLRGRHHQGHGCIVHEPRLVLADHVLNIDAVPVASPTLVCFQLAARLHDDRLGRLVDTFWARRMVSWASLSSALDQLAVRGRPGIRAMRAVLDARGPDHIAPESNLEIRMAALLDGWPFGEWRRQAVIGDAAEPLGRVDFVHAQHRLIIECQSASFHAALTQRRDDDLRLRRLRAAGYVVIEAWDRDIWHHPQVIKDAVRAELMRLQATPHSNWPPAASA